MELECSAVLLERDAKARQNVEVISPLRDFPFDAAGNLPADGIHAAALTAGAKHLARAAGQN